MLAVLLEKLNAYVLCIRSRMIDRVLSFIWASLVGLLVGARGFPPLLDLIEVMVIVFAVGNSVYIFNDIMEVELDRLNRVNRPIAQGKVSRKDAACLVLILTILSLALSLYVNLETFLLTVSFLTLGFLYSAPQIYLKKRFLAKQLILAIGGFISTFMGGTVMGIINPRVIFVSFLFFVLCLAGSPLGDLADLRGDIKMGIKSITTVYGPEFAVKVAIVFLILTGVITLLCYSWIGFNILAPMLVTSSSLVLAFMAYPLMKRWRDREFCLRTIKRMVVVHFVLQLGLVLGAL